MDFIKQLIVGSQEDWVHARFTRYGRGVFDGPAVEAKVGKAIKVSGSEEYCNTLGLIIVESCRGLFEVSGSIVGKSDFRGILKDSGVSFRDKSRKGLYSVEVSGDLASDVLGKVYSGCGDASVLLGLKSGEKRDFTLKCKKKLPKPGGKKDSDFVSASLGLNAMGLLRGEVFFDVAGDFAEASVSHKYNINEIIVPQGIKDPARVRVEAKRKGSIERTVVADGKRQVSKTDFSA